jgi:hypothetical protein
VTEVDNALRGRRMCAVVSAMGAVMRSWRAAEGVSEMPMQGMDDKRREDTLLRDCYRVVGWAAKCSILSMRTGRGGVTGKAEGAGQSGTFDERSGESVVEG